MAKKIIKKINKRGDLPFWMVMLIWCLMGVVVILIIIGLQRGKLLEFLEWLG